MKFLVICKDTFFLQTCSFLVFGKLEETPYVYRTKEFILRFAKRYS